MELAVEVHGYLGRRMYQESNSMFARVKGDDHLVVFICHLSVGIATYSEGISAHCMPLTQVWLKGQISRRRAWSGRQECGFLLSVGCAVRLAR